MDTLTVASLLHIASDLPAFIGYSLATMIAHSIYSQGKLSSSPEAHPELWRTGIAFLVLSAMVRLASGTQALLVIVDQDLPYLTLTFKFPLAFVAGAFVWQIWRKRYEFITMGLIWKAVRERTDQDSKKTGGKSK